MKQNIYLAVVILIVSMVAIGCRAGKPSKPASPAEPVESLPSSAPTNIPASSVPDNNAAPAESSGAVTIKAEVWADNWFAFYSGAQLIKEDSVSITTERSFNSETFTFESTYPLVLNFIAKDFKENDSGLEYIGTNRQQMGDGGLIAQFMDASTGKLIAATDSNWACVVIHEAPLDKACEKSSNPIAGEMPCGFTSTEEPAGWKDAGFDSSAWSPATIYSAAQVGPKDGYNQISWNPSAQFIWGPDLETNNTILCRLTVAQPR